jgi:uncharacterized protein (DUF2252 family)
MANLEQSVRAYESWMRQELGAEIVDKDLARKHDKMAESPFVFLRATFWRWAETILQICPELAQSPSVLAVGDIHLENYGTWRDEDGRLVWGVNDFDEAAEMPYAVDLVRLATSALLSRPEHEWDMPAAEICTAILDGYSAGLHEPRAIVLDRDWARLRSLVVVDEDMRAKFWKKIDKAKYMPAPARYVEALAKAMPDPHLQMRTAPRTAGTGSLGRPRWIGVADWMGAPVVREVKVILPSAWPAGQRCTTEEQTRRNDLAARGRFRANDPWYRLDGNMLVRRLSPNNRKLEAEGSGVDLLTPDMLGAMGQELANVHLGTSNPRAAILQDLEGRKPGWLRGHAKQAATAVIREFKEWRSR